MPVPHHMMKTSNNTISDRSPPGATRTAPSAVHQDGGVKNATGASSKISRRDNITIGTWKNAIGASTKIRGEDNITIGTWKNAIGASSKIRGEDNITIGTWNTGTIRAARKLRN